jgi:DNA repair exonuclease SbcCD nuclease subunit
MKSEKVRFVHAADLHIDSPFKGISNLNPELAQHLSEATYRAFENIIDLCIEEKVDFLLIAGDIYDSSNRSLRAQLKFRQGLERLAHKDIPAFIVHGNHDPLDKWSKAISWPENTHIFKGKKVQIIPFTKNGREIAHIYGISFHTKEIRESLVGKFPKDKGACWAIGLLHANAGNNTAHDSYSPCSLKELIDVGMDYWALGHVHKHQILRDDNPVVLYPGNPQGRNPREDLQRGCYLIELESDTSPQLRFMPVDVIRFENRSVDISSKSDVNDVMKHIQREKKRLRETSDGRDVVLRLQLTGRTPLCSMLRQASNVEDLLRQLNDGELAESPFVWIDRITSSVTSQIDLDKRAKGKDFIANLLSQCKRYESDPDLGEEMRKELESLFQNWSGSRRLDVLDDKTLHELLEEAKMICVDRLIET